MHHADLQHETLHDNEILLQYLRFSRNDIEAIAHVSVVLIPIEELSKSPKCSDKDSPVMTPFRDDETQIVNLSHWF